MSVSEINKKKLPNWLVVVLVFLGVVLLPLLLVVLVALAPFIVVYMVTVALCDLSAEKQEKRLKLEYKLNTNQIYLRYKTAKEW